MKNLTDQNLLKKIKLLVKAEHEATYEVLLHLREVERRMLREIPEIETPSQKRFAIFE